MTFLSVSDILMSRRRLSRLDISGGTISVTLPDPNLCWAHRSRRQPRREDARHRRLSNSRAATGSEIDDSPRSGGFFSHLHKVLELEIWKYEILTISGNGGAELSECWHHSRTRKFDRRFSNRLNVKPSGAFQYRMAR